MTKLFKPTSRRAPSRSSYDAPVDPPPVVNEALVVRAREIHSKGVLSWMSWDQISEDCRNEYLCKAAKELAAA